MIKRFQSIFWLVILFSFCSACVQNTAEPSVSLIATPLPEVKKTQAPILQKKAAEALAYCKNKKLNRQLCFLLDMSIHSGKNRFFVWDFEQQKVVDKGLVSHGCCQNEWGADATKTKPVFSNVEGSHCSSLGKYKVGERGYSQWGINIKYLLHGLEKSNRNALERYIVLHGWNLIANEQTYPQGTPEGWGCPAVSNDFMRRLDKRLKQSEGEVLMWIYQ